MYINLKFRDVTRSRSSYAVSEDGRAVHAVVTYTRDRRTKDGHDSGAFVTRDGPCTLLEDPNTHCINRGTKTRTRTKHKGGDGILSR